MTNSQLSVLCGAFLTGSLLVAGSNLLLVRSARVAPPDKRLRIAMIPRFNGDPYFVSCREGAEEAARELDVHLIWEGTNTADSTAQFQLVQSWLDRRVDAIAVAASEPSGISLVLRQARARGIPVVTWDSDAQLDARKIFVNPIDVDKTTRMLAAEAAALAGGTGEIAVLSGESRRCPEALRANLADRHAAAKVSTVELASSDREEAFRATQESLRASPSLQVIVAFSPMAVEGAAEALLMSARKNVRVIGAQWEPRDLGYLTVYVATGLAQHNLDPSMDSILAGRLGKRDFCGGEIVLGPPLLAGAHP